MTQDEIIEMARQAKFPFNKYGLLQGDAEGEIDADAMFEAFAKLVAAKEREACAKVVDAKIEEVKLFMNEHHLLQVAAAIRARGQE